MKSLPADIIPEVYAVNSSNPWLHLLHVHFPYEDIYLVRNTEDVEFNGRTYTAFPFDPDIHRETGDPGEIPTRVIRVSNVLQLMEQVLENLGGAVGSTVTWTTVNYKNLASKTAADYADFEVSFEILSTEIDSQWVTFTLGAPFLNLQRFPLDYYDANYCNWVRCYALAGQECNFSEAENWPGGPDLVNYPDADASYCDGTLHGPNGCEAHNNQINWGGYVGLKSNAFRLA